MLRLPERLTRSECEKLECGTLAAVESVVVLLQMQLIAIRRADFFLNCDRLSVTERVNKWSSCIYVLNEWVYDERLNRK